MVRQDALAASEEALALARDLGAADPKKHHPLLARSLRIHANALYQNGQLAQALECAREAAETARTPKGEWARALVNEAHILSAMGAFRETIDVAEIAISALIDLAADQPLDFAQPLADAFNSRNIAFHNLGKFEQALEAATQAVDHMRTLMTLRPDIFAPVFSGS